MVDCIVETNRLEFQCEEFTKATRMKEDEPNVRTHKLFRMAFNRLDFVVN